ncbi:MAG: pyruvate, water dikinase regulatory protein [Anaerolineae bacterium]
MGTEDEARPTVFVVSGGAGSSGERIVRTALAQFQTEDVNVVIVPFVRDPSEIDEVAARASLMPALIVHTLVVPELRETMYQAARRHHVVAIDLMGPLLGQLAELLGREPIGQPGLYRQLNQAYFDRIEAIDFTVQHDDGRKAHELDQAEIVLVGVSRVSKTPLSIYLGTRGWKVGNVPIVPGVPLPQILYRLPKHRVVGLTLRPQRLAAIRRLRSERLMGGQVNPEYASPDAVEQELAYAQSVFSQAGWAVIDMTHKSIEDAAAEVVAIVTQGTRG